MESGDLATHTGTSVARVSRTRGSSAPAKPQRAADRARRRRHAVRRCRIRRERVLLAGPRGRSGSRVTRLYASARLSPSERTVERASTLCEISERVKRASWQIALASRYFCGKRGGSYVEIGAVDGLKRSTGLRPFGPREPPNLLLPWIAKHAVRRRVEEGLDTRSYARASPARNARTGEDSYASPPRANRCSNSLWLEPRAIATALFGSLSLS